MRAQLRVGLVAIGISTHAWAQDSYQGTLLATDAVAAGAGVTAVFFQESAAGKILGGIAVGTYLAGAPILHIRRNGSERALISLSLRVGAPAAFGLAGLFVGGRGCQHYGCALVGAVVGAGVGALAGALLDDFVFSTDSVSKNEQPVLFRSSRSF